MDDKVRLVATIKKAADIEEDESFGLYDLYNPSDLDSAINDGRRIYEINEETGQPEPLLFDGEKWIQDKPEFIRNEAQEVSVATSSYVEAIAEVVQSEIEAIVNEMGPAVAVSLNVSSTGEMSLKDKIAVAREALHDADPIKMATASQLLSPKNNELFTMEQAKEMTSGATRE